MSTEETLSNLVVGAYIVTVALATLTILKIVDTDWFRGTLVGRVMDAAWGCISGAVQTAIDAFTRLIPPYKR